VAFVYLLRPVRPELPYEPTAEEQVTLGAHADYLERGASEGWLVCAGPSLVAPGDAIGITILDVDDEAEARRVMEADPAVSGGIMTGELRPFRLFAERAQPNRSA
jgi:uncharacterized protein YciI